MGFFAGFKRFAACAAAAALLTLPAHAADIGEVRTAIDGVIRYKGGEGFVLDALSPGESDSDWLAYAVGMSGARDNYQGYLDRLSAYVAEKYANNGGLDKNKATEWHRTALTVKALGGNPADFGGVNLIKDGVTEPIVRLDRQGINGLIWAAVTARECGAEFNGDLTLSGILDGIASRQNADGGFSLRGGSDPDVTAMAVRALCASPDYRQYAELGLSALEAMKLPSGGFASFGVENCESTAQVIMALCDMGRLPTAEADVLLTYRNADGGFAHVLGGKSDDMASAQAMAALIAYEKALTAAQTSSEQISSEQPSPEPTSSEQVSSEQISSEPPSPKQASPEQTSPVQNLPEQASPEQPSPEQVLSAPPEIKAIEADGKKEDKQPEKKAEEKPEESSGEKNSGKDAAAVSVVGVSALAAAAYLLAKRK